MQCLMFDLSLYCLTDFPLLPINALTKAPPTPQATALSDTEILVTWEPALSSCTRPTVSHQVRAAPSGTEDYTNCLLNTTTGQPYRAVCVGLSRGTVYVIDVIALGPMGSTASSDVTVSTFDGEDLI